MKGELLSRVSLNGNQIDEQGCHCRTYTHLHMELECRYELTTQDSVIINWLLFSEINLIKGCLPTADPKLICFFLLQKKLDS